MNKNIIFSLILTFMLIMSASSIYAGDKDLILSAKYDIKPFNPSDSYLKKDLVLFENEIYEIVNAYNSLGQTPLTEPDLFTLVEGNQLTKIVDKNKVKEVKIKDKTYYNGYVAVTNNDFSGSESLIMQDKLLAVDDYDVNEYFNVTYYTGNDGVTYDVMWYNGTTSDRQVADAQGVRLFQVTSVDGFVTYQTEHFTTQILAMPDVYMIKNDIYILPTDGYFVGHNPDNTIVSVEAVPSNWGYTDNQFELTKETLYEEVNPDFDLTHRTATIGDAAEPGIDLGEEVIRYESYNAVLSFRTYVIVVDNASDYDGDNYEVFVIDAVNQTASIANVNLTGSNGVQLSMSDYFDDFEFIEVAYTDNGANNLTVQIDTSDIQSNYDDIDVILDSTPTDIELNIFGNNVNYGGNTFTVTARGYDDSTAQTTFQVQVTATAPPPAGGGGGNLNNGTLLYYNFDDVNLSGSVPIDLTGAYVGGTNNGATTGVVGILNEGFDFESTEADNLQTSATLLDNLNSFSVSVWVKPETVDAAVRDFAGLSDGGSNIGHIGMFNDDVYFRFSHTTGESAVLNPTSSNTFVTGQWFHVVYTYDGTNLEAFVNGTSVGTQTSAGHTVDCQNFRIGSNNGGGDNYFDGVMDEMAFFDYAINQTEIDFLYNNGVPGTDQVYEFVEGEGAPANPPTQILSFPDVNINVYDDFPINLEARFNGSTDHYFWFTSPDNASLVNMTNGNTFFGNTFNASITSDTLLITGVNNQSALTLNFYGCNVNGCSGNTSTMTISGASIPTSSITQSFATVTLFEDDSQFYTMESYYSNYDDIYVTYTDPDNSSLINLTNGQSSNNTYYQISLSSFDLLTIATNVDYNDTLTNETLSVQVCNEFGCRTDNDLFSFSVQPDPTDPPVQIASLSDVDYEVLTNNTYDYKTFFANATGYNITFYNQAIASNQTLALSQTVDAIDFIITRQFDNTLFIQALDELNDTTIYIEACNVNGCLNYTSFDMDIINSTVPAPTPPLDLDEIFDTIFGEGTTKTKLLVAMIIIVAFFIGGFSFTKTVVGGMLSSVIGFVLTVVFGLISVWVVILVAVLLVLVFLIGLLFQRRS